MINDKIDTINPTLPTFYLGGQTGHTSHVFTLPNMASVVATYNYSKVLFFQFVKEKNSGGDLCWLWLTTVSL